MQFRSLLKLAFTYTNQYTRKLNTQVFDTLTNKQLATPQLVKKILLKPIHMHSRVSQISLYHKKRVRHGIRSCFSQKKTKVFKRVNKVKKNFYSEILGQSLKLTCSKKAIRCIDKAGSLDNYILVTKPKDLDSKKGQYLRELMLRKLNDSQYRIPYILSSKQKKQYSHHQMVDLRNQMRKIIIPKEWKDNLMTMQRPFGKNPAQLNEQDYAKYQQLQSLKKRLGSQFEQNHPLLLELQQKMKIQYPQDEQKLDQMAAEAQDKYLNHIRPKYRQQIRKKQQKRILEYQILSTKYEQAVAKYKNAVQQDK